jgi:formylglycine-generating enzyme required for sulfatase activity
MPKSMVVMWCFLALASQSRGADPAYYQKRATWQDTVRVSRDTLAEQLAHSEAAAPAADPLPAGFEPWLMVKACTDLPPSPRPMLSQKIKLRVAGLKDLYLGAIQLGPSGTGATQWNDAQLVDTHGKKTLLVSLPAAWKGRQDRNAVNAERRQIQLNACEAHFVLDGQYEFLESQVHLDLGEGVIVWAQGRSLWEQRQAAWEGQRKIRTLVDRDFPSLELKYQRRLEDRDHIWLKAWTPGDVGELARRYAGACTTQLKQQAATQAAAARSPADLERISQQYTTDTQCREMLVRLQHVSGESLQRAVADLIRTYPKQYSRGPAYLKRAEQVAEQLPQIRNRLEQGCASALADAQAVLDFQKQALLGNPLLDFGKLLLVRRDGEENLGLASNFGPNTNPGGGAEIDVLSPVQADGRLSTLFREKSGKGLCDVDLEFDADRMLFTMADARGNAQLWEIRADGSGLRQITASEDSDEPGRNGCAVQNCDGCYLPDGRIVFVSTATMVGVPCVGGTLPVGNLYRMDADGRNMQQLTFDQDQSWYPTIMHSGRVLYTRWEYTDTPHYFTRLLFTMNPDGTGQSEFYHSNSYWPNSTFFTRPIPDHPTQVVGVVTGHHGSQRAGELVLIDPAKGRHEAAGVVQRIPGFGQKVEPIIKDQLVNDSWPKFLYPYPLSGKYFLVSCKLTPESPWGIFLVDVFDNLVPLRVEPGYALTEAIPLRKTPRPPVIPDRVEPNRNEGVVYLQDIYQGGGLAGIPRGTVKNLRVFSYAYNYRWMGSHSLVGEESGWDVKRILGTVPVEPDGSALFRVPANTPIALQPLDEQGRALQLMRSWMTARPGETLSCVGCHEAGNSSPPARRSTSAGGMPTSIRPFYGPARGFSFQREVQPVLDKYCTACHNGRVRPDGQTPADFASRELKPEGHSAGVFSEAYLALNPFVRRPGPESDYHMFFPMEWHAGTSELVQLLQKGHHNVALDAEAWDRLYTWIDLNVPYYGTYRETQGRNAWNPRSEQAAVRHRELLKRYADVDVDPESIPPQPKPPVVPVVPPPDALSKTPRPQLAGWPFDEKQAKQLQAAAGKQIQCAVVLADGLTLNLLRVPAGRFVMGDAEGYPDERPLAVAEIKRPFWMAEVEVSNRQFAQFDPGHDSRYQDMPGKDQTARGFPANLPEQPVVRVTWQQAMDYCRWLSVRTGRHFTLPSEAQWEWACRAGAEIAPPGVLGRIGQRWGAASNVGVSQPNAWGLKDIYGNAAEWTRTAYRPYPYRDDDGRNDLESPEDRVVRGGSWADSPQRARAGFRTAYRPYQHVFNVGFRVICED